MTQASTRPSAMAGYEDWPAYAGTRRRYVPAIAEAQELVDALGVPAVPSDVTYAVDSEAKHDGVITSRLSWQLGFGPRTSAWFVRPADATAPVPGLLALHCHAGIKSHGAARLVALPHALRPPGHASRPSHVEPDPTPGLLQQRLYGGRALATSLAQQGFAVLAHDAFMWGSRRFDLDPLPWRTAAAVDGRKALWRVAGVEPSQAELYDAAASIHEETVAKAATLLGTSLAGTVAHDDLAALGVLASLPGVDAGSLGCLGFSGGGGRAMVLAALSPLVRSFAVTCMMTTFSSLLPAYLDAHSWLLHTPGLPAIGDWPELAVRSAAERVLVQYALDDELFPVQGIRDADSLLAERMAPGRYSGTFWPGPHVFTGAMQDEAAAFLTAALRPSAIGQTPAALTVTGPDRSASPSTS